MDVTASLYFYSVPRLQDITEAARLAFRMVSYMVESHVGYCQQGSGRAGQSASTQARRTCATTEAGA